MVQIDNVGVLVRDRRMPVRMAVRLRSLPALVCMLVVLVVNVGVLVVERLVTVLNFRGVARRPES